MEKTGNKHTLTYRDFQPELRWRGKPEVGGNTYPLEPTHNGFDSHAANQGYFFKKESIYYGNDGDFFLWDDFVDKGIGYGIDPGGRTNTTSYWTVGATKATPYSDGIYDYQCHSDRSRFFLRDFQYPNDRDKLTKQTVNEIISGGCTIVEYEITKEDYDKLTNADEFGFTPTFFVKIRRYEDSGRRYNPTQILHNIEFTLLGRLDKLSTFIQIDDGKKIHAQKKYWPHPIPIGQTFIPAEDFTQLPLIHSDLEINGGIWDVYIFSRVVDGKVKVAEWNAFQAAGGKNQLITLNGFDKDKLFRGKVPRLIVVNHRNMHLIQEDIWKTFGDDILGYSADDRNLTQDIIGVFHEKTGKFEFPTIKTSGLDDITKEEACKVVMEHVKKTKSIQYKKKKAEDNKVDILVDDFIFSNKYKNYQNGLIRSFQYLTDNQLTEQDILNKSNYSIRDAGDREYDLLVAKSDTHKEWPPKNGLRPYLLHGEFQLDTMDWEHIDQISSKTLAKESYYNVLVSDKLSKKKNKRDWLRDNMKKNNIEAKIWVCTYNDLINGNVNEFELIWDGLNKETVAEAA
tara:strand:- start:102 stop:1805 length:1704 start_codon:yes stop_codon:yes gene_type:complete